MASGPSGKFQDHYEVLGIDPKASNETIQRAYTSLAKKFHPSSGESPDAEKFKALNEAYEVLSDPANRKVFDSVRGGNNAEEALQFSGMPFFDGLVTERERRLTILCLLYDQRRKSPYKPMVSLRQFELTLRASREEINFTGWYLKTRGLIDSDDRMNMEISVQGMDYIEANPPDPQLVIAQLKSHTLVPPAPETISVGVM
jgi:curved DNA-binding protein